MKLLKNKDLENYHVIDSFKADLLRAVCHDLFYACHLKNLMCHEHEPQKPFRLLSLPSFICLNVRATGCLPQKYLGG